MFFLIRECCRYCPKVITLLKCDEKLSPIYTECYTAEQIKRNRLGHDIWLSIFENLCVNDAESFVKFISANGTECGFAKQFELGACMRLARFEGEILRPEPDRLCK